MSPRHALRIACLVFIAIFYILSVPWYRDADEPLRIWMGLPDWVAVALLCYVGVAIMNAIAWTLLDVADDSHDSHDFDVSAGSEREDDRDPSPSRSLPRPGGEAAP